MEWVKKIGLLALYITINPLHKGYPENIYSVTCVNIQAQHSVLLPVSVTEELMIVLNIFIITNKVTKSYVNCFWNYELSI